MPAPPRSPTLTPCRTPARRKLAYHEQRELDALPGRIDALESEQQALQSRVAGPTFYKESGSAIAAALARIETLKAELHSLYARWAELDARA